MNIPVCTPTLAGNELRYLQECVETNWISSKGRFITEFEERFAHYVGMNHGVSTTSGTTAIHLALMTLGIKPGDEIIIPDFTMMGSVFPILYCGAKPIPVDIERDTWNIDVTKIEERISDKTKAIMPVHIYGHPCDMEPIIEIAEDHNLSVIEDAAEAHGAEYRKRKAGSMGDVSCFSFYANKIITTGEGGMILVNDDQLASRARMLKDMAFIPERRFFHLDIGYNYRMTNLQAAIGLAQMEKIDALVEARRTNASRYNNLLREVDGITLPVEKDWAKNVYWMYSVLVDENNFGINRDNLSQRLAQEGIETRPFFTPVSQQPFMQKCLTGDKGTYTNSLLIAENGINLPSGPSLTSEEIKFVTDCIGSCRK